MNKETLYLLIFFGILLAVIFIALSSADPCVSDLTPAEIEWAKQHPQGGPGDGLY